jgi:hypothetical protein
VLDRGKLAPLAERQNHKNKSTEKQRSGNEILPDPECGIQARESVLSKS